MVRFTGGLLLFSAFHGVLAAPGQLQQQQPLTLGVTGGGSNPKKIHGRFLHITDLHPDGYYQPCTTKDEACHRGSGHAGIYGHETTDCDSPLALVNATFDWIKHNVADEIDFVIWTGDSARHDNDDSLPRSVTEVVDLNKYTVSKFAEVFGKEDNINDTDPTNDFTVPIIPTFGNNDILPHNIFEPGPNKWTKDFEGIWDQFIPEEQRHSFARGGWFYTEVIPGKLAVFSLNTMYFFTANSAVDGCDKESEPGYEHFEWLRVQLQFLRARGMKAIITGHVPPARTRSKQSWDETCWQKYTLWMTQYRDVIVGQMFGHANIDHFMFQDVRELTYDLFEDDEASLSYEDSYTEYNETFTIQSKDVYLKELREDWSELPKPPSGMSYLDLEDGENTGNDEVVKHKKSKKKKKEKKKEKFLKAIGGAWAEHFNLALVSASVVPNYFPTLRVIEYNMSGLEKHHLAVESQISLTKAKDEEDDSLSTEKHKKHKVHNKPRFKIPKAPSRTSPPGPAFSPQTFTFLSYTQYYANLTTINAKVNATGKINPDGTSKHFKYDVEYDTKTDKHYGLKDLTVRSMLDLAGRIGREKLKNHEVDDVDEAKVPNHAWRAFVKRAFVLTKSDEEIEQDFE